MKLPLRIYLRRAESFPNSCDRVPVPNLAVEIAICDDSLLLGAVLCNSVDVLTVFSSSFSSSSCSLWYSTTMGTSDALCWLSLSTAGVEHYLNVPFMEAPIKFIDVGILACCTRGVVRGF